MRTSSYTHVADSLPFGCAQGFGPLRLGLGSPAPLLLRPVADSLPNAHLADSFAQLHCVPPSELGSTSFRLVRAA
jgi:hypothetical protein